MYFYIVLMTIISFLIRGCNMKQRKWKLTSKIMGVNLILLLVSLLVTYVLSMSLYEELYVKYVESTQIARMEKIEEQYKNVILKITDVSYGGVAKAVVEPKDLLHEAVKIGAPKMIVIHNHPSGDSEPSLSDIEITERIDKASKIMGIQLLDHIVIGDGNYVSIFSRRGSHNV